jgi:hypothetical protein
MKTRILSLSVLMIAASSWASGPVSAESARNQINANMDDWKNESAQVSSLKNIACRDTKIEEAIYGHALVPSPVLVVDGVKAFANGDFNGVTLTSAERDQLQAIENAAKASPADRLQAQINLQQLAMAVSNRSYSDAIETYLVRAVAAESTAKLDGVADRCNEYTLRMLRDQDMIAAAQTLLNLYSQLDQATN